MGNEIAVPMEMAKREELNLSNQITIMSNDIKKMQAQKSIFKADMESIPARISQLNIQICNAQTVLQQISDKLYQIKKAIKTAELQKEEEK